ncbi:MAG: Fic family protein [Verrucomicrobiae bacterium]|nr:Fic family protein [Verrucomicrobiae bacterium]
MPDWDQSSPRLAANLTRLLEEIHQRAERREPPAVAMAKAWQIRFLDGLDVPDPRFVGAFRGESGLENLQVRIGPHFGVAAAKVAEELARFEKTLRALVAELDAELPAGQSPDADQLAAILDLCAWVHAEWVRIHPLPNGNGWIARLWANSLAMRYGLPPFIGLRPRPGSGYEEASARAMQGDWEPTAVVFRRFLDELLRNL